MSVNTVAIAGRIVRMQVWPNEVTMSGVTQRCKEYNTGTAVVHPKYHNKEPQHPHPPTHTRCEAKM